MKKILLGLAVALVIPVAGFFGSQFYVQQRIAGEIDTAFGQIRSAGGKASHGKISFDLLKHIVTIADIEGESGSPQPIHIKIATITATGVGQPDATHVSADSVDVTDIEIGVEAPAQTISRVTYQLPRVAVKDYSGPSSVRQLPASSSLNDLYQFVLELLADTNAASIAAPTLTGKITSSAAMPGSDFSYSGLAMENIKDGKIATIKADGFVFTMDSQVAGKPEKMTANLANLVAHDVDVGPMVAMFDPKKATDDRYYRVYRQISAGPYVITSSRGLKMRMDAMSVDDVRLRPSRSQFSALMALIPPPGTAPPTPAQAREMMEKAANFYEGIWLGNGVISGISVEAPPVSAVKLGQVRVNMQNGKGDIAFEGLDASTPEGPLRMERFTLKALDLPSLMRVSAQFANPAQPPQPQQVLQLLQVLGGAEVKGVVAPFKNSRKTVKIDAINLNWGQFVGTIPTRVHLDARLASPVDASLPAISPLAIAGIDTMSLDVNLSTAWDEASGAFVLDAPTFEMGSFLNASAHVALAKVPREVFMLGSQQATDMAAQIEAGTLELSLRDLGAVDAFVVQYARIYSISRDVARSAIVDSIRDAGQKAAAANPDAPAAIDALVRFVETPRQTLLVKLTPLGKVPAQPLLQMLQSDPEVALAQFRIEASTGL